MDEHEKMMWIFPAFDKPWASFLESYMFKGDWRTWKPGTDEEKQAFAVLIAPENRDKLKRWYRSANSLNGMADAMRQLLVAQIGEPLPIATEASN